MNSETEYPKVGYGGLRAAVGTTASRRGGVANENGEEMIPSDLRALTYCVIVMLCVGLLPMRTFAQTANANGTVTATGTLWFTEKGEVYFQIDARGRQLQMLMGHTRFADLPPDSKCSEVCVELIRRFFVSPRQVSATYLPYYPSDMGIPPSLLSVTLVSPADRQALLDAIAHVLSGNAAEGMLSYEGGNYTMPFQLSFAPGLPKDVRPTIVRFVGRPTFINDTYIDCAPECISEIEVDRYFSTPRHVEIEFAPSEAIMRIESDPPRLQKIRLLNQSDMETFQAMVQAWRFRRALTAPPIAPTPSRTESSRLPIPKSGSKIASRPTAPPPRPEKPRPSGASHWTCKPTSAANQMAKGDRISSNLEHAMEAEEAYHLAAEELSSCLDTAKPPIPYWHLRLMFVNVLIKLTKLEVAAEIPDAAVAAEERRLTIYGNLGLIARDRQAPNAVRLAARRDFIDSCVWEAPIYQRQSARKSCADLLK
jgi:hypothetical protein